MATIVMYLTVGGWRQSRGKFELTTHRRKRLKWFQFVAMLNGMLQKYKLFTIKARTELFGFDT
jgi:hypothetical protein